MHSRLRVAELLSWVVSHYPSIQLFQFPVHMTDHFWNNLSENMFVVLAIIIMPSTSVWQQGVNHPWDRPQVNREDVNSRRWRQCSRVSKCGNNFTAGVSLLLLFIRDFFPCSAVSPFLTRSARKQQQCVLVPIAWPKNVHPWLHTSPRTHPPPTKRVFAQLGDSSGQTLQLAQSHVRNCFLVLTIGHPS